MGDIKRPLRKITLVPMPDDIPLEEPSPDVTPAPVPERRREPVPA